VPLAIPEVLANQVLQDFLAPPVILAKMENLDQLVLQAILVKMAKTATLEDLVQLDQLDQLDTLVNQELLDTLELKD